MTDKNREVFDRILFRLRRNRSASVHARDLALMGEAALRLTERVSDVGRSFDRALDLGCYAGQVGMWLQEHHQVRQVIFSDIAANAVEGISGLRVVADEEALPFANQSFDLVASCLSLQWTNDLPGALIQIRRILTSNGLFVGSMMGGETLRELRDVLLTLEMEEGGASPRVSPFVDVKTMGSLLQRAGFELPVTDSEIVTVSYQNVGALVRELRALGQSNALLHRGVPLSRRILRKMEDVYRAKYPDNEGGIIATFELVTMTGLAAAAKT